MADSGARHVAVVEIVAVKALWNHSDPQLSTEWPQRIQYKTVNFTLFQQISTNAENWFGTGGAEVQILSPRPMFSMVYKQRTRPSGISPGALVPEGASTLFFSRILDTRPSTKTSTMQSLTRSGLLQVIDFTIPCCRI
jgi:hypothetical protein